MDFEKMSSKSQKSGGICLLGMLQAGDVHRSN